MTLQLIACSGPGAGATIYGAELFATMAAYVHAAMLVTTSVLFLRTFVAPYASLLNLGLMALHPAWTTSARGGDCGSTMVMASMVCILVGVTVSGHAIRRYHAFRRTQLNPTPD